MPPLTEEERQALIDAAINNEGKLHQQEKRRRDQNRLRRQAEADRDTVDPEKPVT